MSDGALIRKEEIMIKWERLADAGKPALNEAITVENFELLCFFLAYWIFELGSCAAPIGPGNNLEIMSTRIIKVSSAPSVIGIDLVRPMMMRICPERKPALPDSPKDFVKLHFAHKKGVMLRRNLAVGVVEVQSDLIIYLHRQERSKRSRSRKPENFNKKSCGLDLVARVDDGMV